MSGILDRCVWLATSSGTGSFVDAGAITGYQDMAAAGAVDGQTYPYVAQSTDLSQWEVGLGTWTAGTVTLARTTISYNSAGGATAINFTNPPQVLMTMTAVAMRPATVGGIGGRLTLTSNTPVLTANTTAQGTVYYTPYINANAYCWDGVGISSQTFTQQSVVLDATNFLSGRLYDWFLFLNAGAVDLGYNGAWGASLTARSATLTRDTVTGVWTNTSTITLRVSSSTTFSIAANQAVYVGTTSGTANAQTGMNFIPSAASGGSNNILGVYNAYNKVPVIAICRDSVASYTYATSTWRAANGNANNSISFVDGLGDVSSFASSLANGTSSAAGCAVAGGVDFNSTSATPTVIADWFSGQTATISWNLSTDVTFLPVLGLNKVTMVEWASTTTTNTWQSDTSGVFANALRLSLEM